ncbi:hypothetical protein G6F60_015707 [Rhizopus arrhizus]|nr:hypothetical protein G6F60_015707 [Rhizopus arrhizus]
MPSRPARSSSTTACGTAAAAKIPRCTTAPWRRFRSAASAIRARSPMPRCSCARRWRAGSPAACSTWMAARC